MSVLKFPEWQTLCEEALSERDSGKVLERVVAAETAIFRRLQQLKSGPDGVELRAMDATLQRLRFFVARLRTGWNGESRVVTMPMRDVHGGLAFGRTKRRSRPLPLDSDRSGSSTS
jgi:hypothetical protein